MASRRPIFYRKEKPRSISKTGLLLCLLLAGGVMLVPAGGDYVRAGKIKLRDWALASGLINFDDCVVTPSHAIDCGSHATGTPLSVALRHIGDSLAEAATEKQLRKKAESKVRALALEVDQLSAELQRARLAAGAVGLFQPLNGEVRPTGLAVTNPSPGSVMSTVGQPAPSQPEYAAPTFSPPSDDDEN
jgi:hypothetical protein